MKLPVISLALLASVFAVASAQAHVRLKYPTPRYAEVPGDSDAQLKDGPCGVTGDARTSDQSRVSVFEPGETITVKFTETINHSGFFRISFDDSGQDAFQFPTSMSQVQSTPVLPVLVDGIADGPAGDYTQEITLPNMECENCTLQLIQVMTEYSANGPWDADNIYFQCADIVLRTGGGSGGSGGTGGMGGTAGTGTGNGSGGTAGTSAAGNAGSVGAGGTGTAGTNAAGGATAGAAGHGGSAGTPRTSRAESSDAGSCALHGRPRSGSAALLLAALGLFSSRRWYRSARRSARSRG